MIKPLREQVLVEIDKPEEKTFGGIFIPEIAQEKPRKATVIAVGTGWYDDKKGFVRRLDVYEGDRVLIGTNLKGIDLTFDGKKYELIRENYIFGMLNE